MFGFGKKKDKETPKKRSKIDRLIMGAIVGGAIGSVVGMSIAPKKGKETREIIAQKGKELYEKGQEIATQWQDNRSDAQLPLALDLPAIEDAPAATPVRPQGFFAKLKGKLFRRNKKHTERAILQGKDYKKIPHEVE